MSSVVASKHFSITLELNFSRLSSSRDPSN